MKKNFITLLLTLLTLVGFAQHTYWNTTRYLVAGAEELNSGSPYYDPKFQVGDLLIAPIGRSYIQPGHTGNRRTGFCAGDDSWKVQEEAWIASGTAGSLVWITGKNITNSGGDVLVTHTAHGLDDNNGGMPILIGTAGSYSGYWIADVIDANTFKLKDISTAAIKAYVSDQTIQYKHSQNYAKFYYDVNGVNITQSGAARGYTGTPTNRVYFDCVPRVATPSNSGGDALYTSKDLENNTITHGMSTGNQIRTSTGYKYVTVMSTTTFKLKNLSTDGSHIAFTNTTDITYENIWGASKQDEVDFRGTSSEPVIITNHGGQFIQRKPPEDTNAYNWDAWGGAKYTRFTGKYDQVLGTGHASYQGGFGAFKRGSWGILIDYDNTTYLTSCITVGHDADNIEFDHFEINGHHSSFAGLQFKTDAYTNTMDVTIHDFYIHDTGAEGWYIGNTSGQNPANPPTQQGMLLKAYNFLVVRTGNEIIQTNQMMPGSYVKNFVTAMADLEHSDPFFVFQIQGVTTLAREGDVLYENGINVGWALHNQVGDNSTSSDAISSSRKIKYRNFYFGDARGRFVYINKATAAPLEYENVWIEGLNKGLSRTATTETFSEIILGLDVVTPLFMKNVVIDDAHSATTLKSGGITDAQINTNGLTRNVNVNQVAFVRSGFEGKNWTDIHKWVEFNVQPGLTTASWTSSDWVCHKGLFYYSKGNHTSSTEPQSDATNWGQLFWDTNGYHSQHGSYNGTPTYEYPPDDFRLPADNEYNLRGLGTFDNVSNTLTDIDWEWSYNNSGSPNTTQIFSLPLPDYRDHSAIEIKDRIGAGNWVRRKVTVRDSADRTSATSTSSWIQIN